MRHGKILIGLLSLVALCILVRFSLQFIPSLTIDEVVLFVDDNMGIPYKCKEEFRNLYHTPLFGFDKYALIQKLEREGVVGQVKIKRILPSKIRVDITLQKAEAVLVAVDQNQIKKEYLVYDGKLYDLCEEDWDIYQQKVVKIQVPLSYALIIREYGLDDSFRSVLGMVYSLSGNSSLITMVKYDNNSSNSLGKMVLELASLNAQIFVREEVSATRIAQAIEVVKAEQEKASFLETTKRYDLYTTALVRR
ncbi:MAG: hypothetical protein WCR02_00595 [Sphaerochaetaceae bacterium]|jgi:hypothetical protein